MSIREAVKSEGGGAVLLVHVRPGSKRSGYGGYDQWRRCIDISLMSRASKGTANNELVSLLSEWFGIEKSGIVILSGKKERTKRILVLGVGEKQVVKALENLEVV